MTTPTPQPTTRERLVTITTRLDEHQERLDQDEARLDKYDVIIARLEALQQTMSLRMDLSEPLLQTTAQALARLDEKANSNRLWINFAVSVILLALGSALGVLGAYLAHLLH